LEGLLDGVSAILAAVDGEEGLRLSQIADRVDITPVSHDGLIRVENSWVSTRVMEELILRIPGVADAVVFREGEGEESHLAARISVTEALEPGAIRRHLLESFTYYPSGVCPRQIHLSRDAPPRDPRTSPVEDGLVEVVARVNSLNEVDVDASYLQLGGRMDRIPAVLAELRGRGWRGVGTSDLAGHLSLRMLAARLLSPDS
jgi:hypothetical protein